MKYVYTATVRACVHVFMFNDEPANLLTDASVLYPYCQRMCIVAATAFVPIAVDSHITCLRCWFIHRSFGGV